MAVWAYVLILIIGVAVTVVGLRIGRQGRRDPFEDVRSGDEATEPEAFTSLRETTPLSAVEDGDGAIGRRAPRATLEERLREAREARATTGAEPETSSATSTVDAGAADAPASETTSPVASTSTPAAEPPTGDDAPDADRDGAEPVDAELDDMAATAGTASTSDEVAGADVASLTAPERAEEPAAARGRGVAPVPDAEVAAPPRTEAPDAVAPSRGKSAAEPEPAAASAPSAPMERAVRTTSPARGRVEIRALDPALRDGFAQRWTPLRMRLLARPGNAIGDADAFVRELLEARGLPNDPDDPSMVEASNAYPDIVDPFRLATAVARHADEDVAEPQELRMATVHYRDAVDRLLAADDAPAA